MSYYQSTAATITIPTNMALDILPGVPVDPANAQPEYDETNNVITTADSLIGSRTITSLVAVGPTRPPPW